MISYLFQLKVHISSLNIAGLYLILSGNGLDYDSASINATFPIGATSSTINVPVNLDSILEQWETFELTFTIPTSIQDVVIERRQTTAMGVIIDTTSK